MSKRGIGYIAAIGSNIANYGEKKFAGYIGDGERVRLIIQRADVKKALGSVYKVNTGGNVVALDGDRSFMQNKTTGQKTTSKYEDGRYVMHTWMLPREERFTMGRRRS